MLVIGAGVLCGHETHFRSICVCTSFSSIHSISFSLTHSVEESLTHSTDAFYFKFTGANCHRLEIVNIVTYLPR